MNIIYGIPHHWSVAIKTCHKLVSVVCSHRYCILFIILILNCGFVLWQELPRRWATCPSGRRCSSPRTSWRWNTAQVLRSTSTPLTPWRGSSWRRTLSRFPWRRRGKLQGDAPACKSSSNDFLWDHVSGSGIDYRCDKRLFWLPGHNCQVPTPTSQYLVVEQQFRIFEAD